MWMLIAFGGLASLTSLGAIVGTVFRSDSLAVLTMTLVIFGLVWSRLFGHAEARLLASHTRRMGGSIVSKVRKGQPRVHVTGVSLQGDRQWDVVWMPLVEFAEKNDLWQLKLDLNLPWQHEGYHGFWSRGEMPEKHDQWSVKLPVICQRRSVGRLVIIGHAAGQSQLESLEVFSHLISQMQPEIERLVACLSPAPEPQPAEMEVAFAESSSEQRQLQVVGE
jgi:UDP-GlcNAc:undecaprenyl-phosphate GlcNAc-1-phosphate transferase